MKVHMALLNRTFYKLAHGAIFGLMSKLCNGSSAAIFRVLSVLTLVLRYAYNIHSAVNNLFVR